MSCCAARTTSAPARSRSPSRMRQPTCRAWSWRATRDAPAIDLSINLTTNARDCSGRARAVLLGAADAERQPHDGHVRTGDRVPPPARWLPGVDQAMSRRPSARRVALAGAGSPAASRRRGAAGRRQPADGTDGAGASTSRARDTPLALSAERYLLQLIGNDLSDDPALPPCGPIAGAARRQVRDHVPVVPRGRATSSSAGRGRPMRPRSRSACGASARRSWASSSTGTVTGAAPDEYDRIMGQRDTTFSAEGGAGRRSPDWSAREFETTRSGRPSADGCADRLRFATRRARSRCARNVQYLPGAGATGRPRRRPDGAAVRAGASDGPERAIGAVAPRNGAGAPTRPAPAIAPALRIRP